VPIPGPENNPGKYKFDQYEKEFFEAIGTGKLYAKEAISRV
jgi:hypothetical protein